MIPRYIRDALSGLTAGYFIDPGVRVLGFCLVDSGRIVMAGVLEQCTDDPARSIPLFKDKLNDLPYHFDISRQYVVCERMTVRGKETPNPADLLNVQLVAGALGDYFVTPAEWKGSIDRATEQRRTKSKLTEEELDLPVYGCNGLKIRDVKPKSHKAHNALSAVGICVSVLGRKALR